MLFLQNIICQKQIFIMELNFVFTKIIFFIKWEKIHRWPDAIYINNDSMNAVILYLMIP